MSTRVLHVAKIKGIGGCERHLLSLLPPLDRAGFKVRLLVLEAGHDEVRFIRQAWDAGIDVERAPAGAHADPRAIGAIVRSIRRFSPDLVHTHLIHADLWGQVAARGAGVPAVRTLHNAMAAYRRLPVGAAGRVAGRLAGRTIAISDFVASFARRMRLAPADRIRVVPYGIDAAAWDVDDRERQQARTSMGLAEGDVAVGMASRLIEGKGHTLAFEAVGRARVAAPAIRLLVCGEGPLRPALERSAGTGAANATFLGHIDDVRSFMSACDLMLFPTLPRLGEGFGLAALEASAAGVPVVATAVGALPEVVIDGLTGSVVAPSADALASSLRDLALDRELRSTLGKAGKERASTTFGMDHMVEGNTQVYREAM